jgi:hypothetical protein
VKIRKGEAEVAKNYLSEPELDVLNRIVTLYLEFAELQALNRRPMTMADWIAKLDDFLRLSGRELLDHAGAISRDEALDKAHQEYEAFRQAELAKPSIAEEDFLAREAELKKIEVTRKRSGKQAGH